MGTARVVPLPRVTTTSLIVDEDGKGFDRNESEENQDFLTLYEKVYGRKTHSSTHSYHVDVDCTRTKLDVPGITGVEMLIPLPVRGVPPWTSLLNELYTDNLTPPPELQVAANLSSEARQPHPAVDSSELECPASSQHVPRLLIASTPRPKKRPVRKSRRAAQIINPCKPKNAGPVSLEVKIDGIRKRLDELEITLGHSASLRPPPPSKRAVGRKTMSKPATKRPSPSERPDPQLKRPRKQRPNPRDPSRTSFKAPAADLPPSARAPLELSQRNPYSSFTLDARPSKHFNDYGANNNPQLYLENTAIEGSSQCASMTRVLENSFQQTQGEKRPNQHSPGYIPYNYSHSRLRSFDSKFPGSK
ncbi:hypothetical protein Hypma_005745 [Hypsizygus marmoreus]|uniref:Uncharacterized protein n=1 Tax=Hypsizygus marmoreus TaxID=39966 RepID=A0A369K7Y0_HYPMA|nr:hypothetical protein Hypma_005745 [Hypsizygus marmoreus]